jgi:hypothetical protein
MADVEQISCRLPLINRLLAQVQNKDVESTLGKSGLTGLLRKQRAEHMLGAEPTHYVNTEAEQAEGKAGNDRNGSSPTHSIPFRIGRLKWTSRCKLAAPE